ncbi:hypothetical protein [Saccharopolyspora sp. NPDC050642]|uniref:hypothetical protein n=1 Tax=Saccharopolyspora sp. NPDC050642 TaxID=3157099 RepID=UPI003400E648
MTVVVCVPDHNQVLLLEKRQHHRACGAEAAITFVGGVQMSNPVGAGAPGRRRLVRPKGFRSGGDRVIRTAEVRLFRMRIMFVRARNSPPAAASCGGRQAAGSGASSVVGAAEEPAARPLPGGRRAIGTRSGRAPRFAFGFEDGHREAVAR